MVRVDEGGRIEVGPSEIFVVERRGLETSGFRTIVKVPQGVRHCGTVEPQTNTFGGRPKIGEQFRCDRRGTFEIEFVSKRPWEAGGRTIKTTVSCR